MSVLVIDSSITLAWILLELEFKERVDRAIERLTDTGGVVPYLWHYLATLDGAMARAAATEGVPVT